ncbi:MAG TPA: LysM domain-containing protein, partial [Bacteroidales bacterium]|nr:LysM domain-containing protein [Bacteroidales bacterium]
IVKSKPIVPQKENTPPPTTYKPKYHIVKQGDTLYKIAKKYSTTVNKLCEINRIKENDILSLNQKIKLP